MRARLVVFEYVEGAGRLGAGLGVEGDERRGSMNGDGDEDGAMAAGGESRDTGVRIELETEDGAGGQGEIGENETRATETLQQVDNVWTEQVPILDATTKTFGNSGDRGWMGRTVSVADVAARWCSFAEVPMRGRP